MWFIYGRTRTRQAGYIAFSLPTPGLAGQRARLLKSGLEGFKAQDAVRVLPRFLSGRWGRCLFSDDSVACPLSGSFLQTTFFL